MKRILSGILIAIMLITSMLTFTACELDLSNLPFDIPIDEIKDALDQHNWEYYYTIEDPTCSKKGVDLYSCSDCGLIKKVDTPTLEHTYGHWIIDKAPTDAEDGLKHRECLICGYKTEPEPASTTGLQSYTLGMGIGLRQLFDLARAYYYLNGKVEHHTMRDTFKTLGLTKWNMLLHAFIVKHIGLPWQYQPYVSLHDIDTAPLFSIIRESGNFGQHAKGSASRSPLKTALSFWKRKRFARKYAFREYLWIMLRLTKGRL